MYLNGCAPLSIFTIATYAPRRFLLLQGWLTKQKYTLYHDLDLQTCRAYCLSTISDISGQGDGTGSALRGPLPPAHQRGRDPKLGQFQL